MTHQQDKPGNISFPAFYAASRKKRQVLRTERRLQPPSSATVRFDSNDYFALQQDARVIAAGCAAAAQEGAGAGASRLAGGNSAAYAEAEDYFSTLYTYPACLIFGSGYAANSGALSALCDRHDMILADKYSHACMVDGARLSGARLIRFRHSDVNHAESLLKAQRGHYRKCIIMTETIFSMDGDAAPVDELSALARRYDALLYADHAHGPGFMTPDAATIDILSGTFSKAYGSYGGYICASEDAKDHLINHARPFMFSTALPPFCIAAAVKAATILKDEPQRVSTVLRMREILLQRLHEISGYVPPAPLAGAIIPYIVQDNDKASALSATLSENGFTVPAIRPPTVPPGSARLRFTLNAAHTEEQIIALTDAIRR